MAVLEHVQDAHKARQSCPPLQGVSCSWMFLSSRVITLAPAITGATQSKDFEQKSSGSGSSWRTLELRSARRPRWHGSPRSFWLSSFPDAAHLRIESRKRHKFDCEPDQVR